MQERALKTKSNILRTAQKLFAKHGYHATSVDLIAKKAKANKQRIYAYFTNKSKLFEASLIAAYNETNQHEGVLISAIEKAPEKITSLIVNHFIKLHAKYPDFWRLITWANLENEPFYKCIRNINDSTLTHIQPFFEQNQQNGILPKTVSFEVYMFNLFAISYFYHSNRKTLSYTLTPDLFTDKGMQKVIRETLLLIR
jgi:AcrR family transcriptional regulator